MNKVMLIGNLGRDPEVRSVGGSKVVNLSVAMSERWSDYGDGYGSGDGSGSGDGYGDGSGDD